MTRPISMLFFPARQTCRRMGFMAALALSMLSVWADDFCASSGNGNWNAAGSWIKVGGSSSRTYPQYPYDTAWLTNNYGAGYQINIPVSGTAMGCSSLIFHARPDWYTKIDLVTGYNASGTLTFQSMNGPAVLQVLQGTEIHIGYRYGSTGILNLLLKSDLLITNGPAYAATIKVGEGNPAYAQTRIIDDGSPHTITLQANDQKALVFNMASLSNSTFRGQWVVTGGNATLQIARDGSLGDPENRLTLRNSGKVSLPSGFNWTRDLIVDPSGGRLGISGTLTNSTGRFIFPVENASVGTLSVSGPLFLDDGSTLVMTNALPDGCYSLIASTAEISGQFGRAVWPTVKQGSVYELSYGSTNVILKVKHPGLIVSVY